MSLFRLDPVQDARWADFVDRCPQASIFHSVGWLRALKDTYGYKPVGFATAHCEEKIDSAMVFCEIDSWLTGRRLVSLPFSDHCEPLLRSSEEFGFLVESLQSQMKAEKWKYLEVRPTEQNLSGLQESAGFVPAQRYFLHLLDLDGDLKHLFGQLDKDSAQRRIQHAERTGLTEKTGNSEELLRQFYPLFIITRSRHRVPPMPFSWFQNLIHNLDRALEIRVAFLQGKPVAGILTLQFKNILYYKYGCSNPSFNKLGAMPWLLWRAVCDAKVRGLSRFDLGRTEEENAGLLNFKNHWVSSPKRLIYWRFPSVPSFDYTENWKLKLAKCVFACMPSPLLTVSGRLLYKHIG